MKRRAVRIVCGSVITIISTLSVAVSTTVEASEITLNSEVKNTKSLEEIQTSPKNLVYLAHRGYFSDRGIPSALALVTAYSLNNISAEDLVRAGVETGRVSPNVLKDAKYINGVESMLNNLKTR